VDLTAAAKLVTTAHRDFDDPEITVTDALKEARESLSEAEIRTWQLAELLELAFLTVLRASQPEVVRVSNELDFPNGL
jgi:hypothetical protein